MLSTKVKRIFSPPPNSPQFVYRAIITRIVYGDTVYADIDLRLNNWEKGQILRLYGIDAPEIKGKDRKVGMKAKKILEGLIPPGKEVIIKTFKDKKGKYGRWLAPLEIYKNKFVGCLR